jgi:hypothetical protein
MRLLLDGNLYSLASIAGAKDLAIIGFESVGYNHPNHFAVVYCQYFGAHAKLFL